MKHYFPEILFLISLLSTSVADRACDKQSELHESKETTRCCIPITVDKGYQPVICDNEGEEASSEPCPANTYQSLQLSSYEFRLCERHSACPVPNMITLRNGSSTSNTICQCNAGDGYYSSLSENTAPTEPYHCLKTETASQPSSTETASQLSSTETVSQPSSVHNVAEDPAGTMSSGLAYILIAIFLVVGASVGAVVIYCRKKFETFLTACTNYICENRRKNGNNELSANVPSSVDDGLLSIAVTDPNSRLFNDRSNAAGTDAPLSIHSNQPSHFQAEDDTDPDFTETLSLHSDRDNSIPNHSASLCCENEEHDENSAEMTKKSPNACFYAQHSPTNGFPSRE